MPRIGESQSDFRERLALIHAEALERRQQELREQRSPQNSASDRIRIWERLHQLPLPRDPVHRLIGVIAAQTGLSVEEVQAEQQLRSAPESPAAIGTA